MLCCSGFGCTASDGHSFTDVDVERVERPAAHIVVSESGSCHHTLLLSTAPHDFWFDAPLCLLLCHSKEIFMRPFILRTLACMSCSRQIHTSYITMQILSNIIEPLREPCFAFCLLSRWCASPPYNSLVPGFHHKWWQCSLVYPTLVLLNSLELYLRGVWPAWRLAILFDTF